MKEIPFRIIRSARKSVAIQVTGEGEVLVRCPRRFPQQQARALVEERREWIRAQLEKLAARPKQPAFTQEELEQMKKDALPLLNRRAAHFAPLVGVHYGKITVRCQRSLWGSCSREGNLSFNCLLTQVPAQVLDYVVVHELCHRKQMNHSAAFWEEVERVLPGYRAQRTWLKNYGGEVILRIR